MPLRPPLYHSFIPCVFTSRSVFYLNITLVFAGIPRQFARSHRGATSSRPQNSRPPVTIRPTSKRQDHFPARCVTFMCHESYSNFNFHTVAKCQMRQMRHSFFFICSNEFSAAFEIPSGNTNAAPTEHSTEGDDSHV